MLECCTCCCAIGVCCIPCAVCTTTASPRVRRSPSTASFENLESVCQRARPHNPGANSACNCCHMCSTLTSNLISTLTTPTSSVCHHFTVVCSQCNLASLHVVHQQGLSARGTAAANSSQLAAGRTASSSKACVVMDTHWLCCGKQHD